MEENGWELNDCTAAMQTHTVGNYDVDCSYVSCSDHYLNYVLVADALGKSSSHPLWQSCNVFASLVDLFN